MTSEPERVVPWAVAVLLILLYSLGVLGHDLWTPDEPRVASVARQVAEGAWVVPTLNGSPFLEQPPLYYWCVALIYRLFGYDPPETGRVASAIFGLGGLVWTYLTASYIARGRGRAAARRVGALAALSLGLSLEYFATAHRVVVDGALTFFTTGSAYAFLRGLTTEHRGAKFAWLIGGYCLASLAFLSKGSIGLAASGLALLSIVFALREPRQLIRAHLWLAPLCFLAVAGPWLYLLYLETGLEGFSEIFIKNTLGRSLPMAGAKRAHVHPPYFYFVYLPLHLLPATIFTLGGVLRGLRREGDLEPSDRFAYDLSFGWLGSGFVLLSLATTKRPIYLLPFFPAAAVAGGFWLEAFLQRRADRLYEKGIERLLPVFIFLASPALLCGAFACGVEATWAIAGALAGVGASAGTWISFRRGKRGAALLLWTSGLAVVLLATLHSIIPAVDEMKSLRSVSARVASTVPLDRPIHALKPDETTEGMIPLYTGRSVVPVPTPEKLEALFSERGEIYLLTVDKDRYTPGTPEWEKSQYGSVEHLPHEVLFEDLGKGIETRLFSRTWTWYPSRVFRLLRLRAAN